MSKSEAYPQDVESFLSSIGHGLGPVSKDLMRMIDKNGLRPGNPWDMKEVITSAFKDAQVGPRGEPMFVMTDFRLDDNDQPPTPFGYLAGQEFYADFSALPWNGIMDRKNQLGSVSEIMACNFFGGDCDDVPSAAAAICETNKTYDYSPIHAVSSRDFKDINDATRNFEARFQAYTGKVLVIGAGSNPLCTTFDFSKSDVLYVDLVLSNLKELRRRLKEMKQKPRSYSTRVGSFHTLFPYLNTQRFDLIVMNNSLHYVCEGGIEQRQKTIDRVLSLLNEKGALCGVGPSLSGLVSTPLTNDIRNAHGLYGIQGGMQAYSYSSLGGAQYIEPIFNPELLYGMEEKWCGKAEFSHLSAYAQGQANPDLIRCYEAFSFVRVARTQRPTQCQFTIRQKASTLNPTEIYEWTIHSRPPTKLKTFKWVGDNEGVSADRTFGMLAQSQHFPRLLYQSPLLVCPKLDGELAQLTIDGSNWTLNTEDSKISVLPPETWKPPKPINGAQKRRPQIFIVEMFRDVHSTDVSLWWLETVYNKFKPQSWFSGFWNLPEALGVKSYQSASTRSFCAMLKEPQSDGVVFLNSHDRPGGLKPKHIFFKPKLSVDVQINGKVYELFGNRAKERDHEPNGSMRVFESPFLLNSKCIVAALTERLKHFGDLCGEKEGISLDAVIGFPRLMSALSQSRARNTALAQLWRGQFLCDPGIQSLMVPLARHPDWQLFGVLAESIIQGAPDKDCLLEMYGQMTIAPSSKIGALPQDLVQQMISEEDEQL